MANKKQRMRNRQTALLLVRESICLECGKPGKHFVQAGIFKPEGFYVCDKFYGPNGRRLEP